MIMSEITCGMLTGIQGKLVTIQSDISEGLPVFQVIGNVSSEVKEAKERVRTALKNSGYFLPVKRISINIAPGDLKKRGVSFDVAIAVSILVSMGLISETNWDNTIILGELALDGRILPIHGVLPILYEALQRGITRCILPKGNLLEGELLEKMEIFGFEKLSDVILFFQGHDEAACYEIEERNQKEDEVSVPDFSEIKGQEMAKRAAVIMAAGFHNLLLEGNPGAGKSMIASAIAGIMPPLSWKEKIEVMMIQSAGKTLTYQMLKKENRPFRTPGLGISQTSLIGDGQAFMPGEITFAHHGLLFLDELTEWKSKLLELLRTPMEEHFVTLHGRAGHITFPADFAFIGACNPCPCGYYPDRTKCECSEGQIRRYQAKISGAIRDRIDIFVHCDTPSYEHLVGETCEKTSEQIREQIKRVWSLQKIRQNGVWNARLSRQQMEEYCKLDQETELFMKKAYQNFALTGRGYYKVIRVARTIADLRGGEKISIADLQEALQYRITIGQKG